MGYRRADGRSGFERAGDERTLTKLSQLLGPSLVVVPNVVGLGVQAAHDVLGMTGLVPAGGTKGETVTAQSPPGGAQVERGSTVVLTATTTTEGPTGGGSRLTAKPDAPAAVRDKPWRTIFLDDFDQGRLDRSKWTETEGNWQGPPGYSFDAYYPVPAPAELLQVGTFNGATALRLSARRDSSVPSPVKWKTAQIFTAPRSGWSGGWASPSTVTEEWYEARLWCEGGIGTSEQWWGNSPDYRWPQGGEWDFMEMFNLDAGWRGVGHHSLHYAAATVEHQHVGYAYKPPGPRPEMLNSWHTWSEHRTQQFIRAYCDGQFFGEFRPGVSYFGSIPLPSFLFTNRMSLILGLGVGGYQGSGTPESGWEESDFYVDYVQVWQV